MPPVGIKFRPTYGAARALIIFRPPAGSAGKNFSTSRSNCSAASISVGVHTPGVIGTPFFSTCSVTFGLNPGLTINVAPASIARSACSVVSTVPAPIIISGKALAILRMDSSAAAVRKVTSAQGSPPAISRSASGSASSALSSTTTGTIPIPFSFFIISVIEFLPLNISVSIMND